jgi:small subunit ribosomal protein S2
MLEAGVHFGHQVRKWNPKMKPYIYGKKNGIYIINLQTSIELFKDALNFIMDVVASGEEALIVGTKKQAQSIITEISEETGMHYVNNRWLGGLLTNFSMIKKSIDKLIDLDEMKKDGRWEVKPKKEQSRLEKIYKKLHKNLWGIRNIKKLPGVVIVIDSNFEEIAVYEAKKLNIPIVGIVDTNADPEGISYPVPGNDDAIRSIKLFTTKFGEAVRLGLEKRLSDSLNQEKLEETEASDSKVAEAAAETSGELSPEPVIIDEQVEEGIAEKQDSEEDEVAETIEDIDEAAEEAEEDEVAETIEDIDETAIEEDVEEKIEERDEAEEAAEEDKVEESIEAVDETAEEEDVEETSEDIGEAAEEDEVKDKVEEKEEKEEE